MRFPPAHLHPPSSMADGASQAIARAARDDANGYLDSLFPVRTLHQPVVHLKRNKHALCQQLSRRSKSTTKRRLSSSKRHVLIGTSNSRPSPDMTRMPLHCFRFKFLMKSRAWFCLSARQNRKNQTCYASTRLFKCKAVIVSRTLAAVIATSPARRYSPRHDSAPFASLILP